MTREINCWEMRRKEMKQKNKFKRSNRNKKRN